MEKPDPAARRDRLLMIALACLPIAVVLLRGFDANWDLRNYHLYNPHAWLTGRMLFDVAPAQLQSWHNPLLDVPLYLIVSSGADVRWASLWLALPGVACVLLLFRLQDSLGGERGSAMSRIVLALFAVSGAAMGSTLGLSMNDGFVAAAMLGSLVIVLGRGNEQSGLHRWFLAGLLAGAITGLKLAAIFYCVALAVASLVEGPGWRRLRNMAALGVGGLLGFSLTYAYWGWTLYSQHANPFFPYYNNFFGSPDALPQSWTDTRFRAETAWEALSSPFELLRRTQEFSEIPLKDPRLLIGLLGFMVLLAMHRRQPSPLRTRLAVLLAFIGSAWLLWVVQYGIYRYAVALELIGCLAAVLLVQRLPRWRNVALVATLLLVSADTRRPGWGHIGRDQASAGIVSAAISDDSLVVIASQEPLAYVALGMPASVPIVAVWNNMMEPAHCSGLQMRARELIAKHDGPIWLLNADAADTRLAQQRVSKWHGLQAAGDCLDISSAIGPARLCPQRRTARLSAPVCAAR